MRRYQLIAALGALALTAACSQSDDHSAASATASVAHNTDVRNAEAEFKKAGHDAAKDFRKLAAQAKIETHKLASDTRGAAHDVTHNDHDHDRSDSDRNS
jgi:hypothetical protein